MHWSLLNKDSEHLYTYRSQYKNIGWYINCIGSSILALISLISFFFVAKENLIGASISAFAWVEFIFAGLLCLLVFYINSKAYTGSKKDIGTIEAIDRSMENYYQKLCAEERLKDSVRSVNMK